MEAKVDGRIRNKFRFRYSKYTRQITTFFARNSFLRAVWKINLNQPFFQPRLWTNTEIKKTASRAESRIQLQVPFAIRPDLWHSSLLLREETVSAKAWWSHEWFMTQDGFSLDHCGHFFVPVEPWVSQGMVWKELFEIKGELPQLHLRVLFYFFL